MSTPTSGAIAVGAPGSSGAGLSKEQALFNSLVAQIGRRRDVLAAWERILPDFQQAFAGQLTPLRSAADALERRRILALDAQFDNEGLSASERRMVSSLLVSLASKRGDLSGDDALKAVFNRHSASDYDEGAAEQVSAMKAELEEWLGQSLGRDEDFSSSQELLRHARRKLADLQAQEAARKEARAERRAERAKAKKPAVTLLRRETLQAELKQSLREIYRKLASALHPDREPDPELKLRKTAMLQAVNQAYDKQDLLHLLEVQVELQQLDRNGFNDLGDDRLRHYNKLLREQLDELEQELAQTESQFAHGYDVALGPKPTPESALATLKAAIARQASLNADAESDLAQFGEAASFKRWLKDVKRRQKEEERERRAYRGEFGE
ncbi:J domain-containing protein [Herbaspirillum sp. WKF16]|uniref:J domain-containing protein n=1 Tax=Herbaspirillum sp. WKF16 TaxID=3028312 RepID=UPI0023A97A45|nr:J domain-containing protein [Herbaspirillum sp. WKF16]WDZ96111.1 J domain-containing protein [Herbaspirillum sp. WKF16]